MNTQSFVIGAVIVGGLAIIFIGIQMYPAVLRTLRRDDTLETFKAHFEGRRYPGPFIEAAYRHFQQLAGVRGFPVRPSDKLSTVYGLADDDLFDTLAELCKLAWDDSCLPSQLPPIDTVEDAIEFALTSHQSTS